MNDLTANTMSTKIRSDCRVSYLSKPTVAVIKYKDLRAARCRRHNAYEAEVYFGLMGPHPSQEDTGG
jgi:hypothetical protein